MFTDNFENDGGQKVTGPLISRPFYLGLDYKLFQFVRFNAGGAILEEPEMDAAGMETGSNRIFLQPFIGVSAKINLYLSLDR